MPLVRVAGYTSLDVWTPGHNAQVKPVDGFGSITALFGPMKAKTRAIRMVAYGGPNFVSYQVGGADVVNLRESPILGFDEVEIRGINPGQYIVFASGDFAGFVSIEELG